MLAVIALGAWMGGIAVSYINGNRLAPTIFLLLGLGVLMTMFMGILKPGFAYAGIALLAAIIWVMNKAEDLR